MIRLDQPALYDASLGILQRFAGGRYYGRLVQIFLACKYYGALIPPLGSSTGIDIGEIQRILDELYSKNSRQPGPSILILFNNNHLFPTGVTGPGRAAASNIWRNNFNIQKGFGCFAPTLELNNAAFRSESRLDCPHLRPAAPGVLRGAVCEFAADAEYRNEDHPKIFRIDPGTRDLFVYDPSDISNYRSFVAPDGRRIPIAPLICALYHDSDLAAGRAEIDVQDFMLDFNFSNAEVDAYFDQDPALPAHADLLAAFPHLSWTRVPAAAAPGLAAPAAPLFAPAPGLPRRRVRRPAAAIPPEDLPASAHPVAPPAGGRWWDAEEVVKSVLVGDGWEVIDRRKQSAGFDFQASKAGRTIFVEVKSSAGLCAPNLTAKEFREATRLSDRYIMAVVENFEPTRPARILWIRDPASMSLGSRTVEVYPLPRALWLRHAKVEIDE
jgi:hypothetical protein